MFLPSFVCVCGGGGGAHFSNDAKIHRALFGVYAKSASGISMIFCMF